MTVHRVLCLKCKKKKRVNKAATERKKDNMLEMLPFNCSWGFWGCDSSIALHIGKTETSSSHLRHCKSVPSKNIMPTPHSFDSHACHLILYSETGSFAFLWVSILALIVQKGLNMTMAVTWPPSFADDAIQAFMCPLNKYWTALLRLIFTKYMPLLEHLADSQKKIPAWFKSVCLEASKISSGRNTASISTTITSTTKA